MPTMWGDTDLEDTILGWFYLVSKRWRDRSPQAMIEHVNEKTGLPDRAQDLQPDHRAVVGEQLAASVTPTPGGLVSSMIRYHSDPSLLCTERRDCEGCRQLDQKPRKDWTREEVELQAAGTYRMKLAAHRLASHGWVDVQPRAMDGEQNPFGEDGLTTRFGITHTGLEEAHRRATDRPEWHTLVRGWKEALTASEWKDTPEWLQAQQRHQAIQVG